MDTKIIIDRPGPSLGPTQGPFDHGVGVLQQIRWEVAIATASMTGDPRSFHRFRTKSVRIRLQPLSVPAEID